MIAEAEKIAKAFGLQGVDILRTQPTDVNTKAAGNDAAGRYGIALAALAQYAKDTGQGMHGLRWSSQLRDKTAVRLLGSKPAST